MILAAQAEILTQPLQGTLVITVRLPQRVGERPSKALPIMHLSCVFEKPFLPNDIHIFQTRGLHGYKHFDPI